MGVFKAAIALGYAGMGLVALFAIEDSAAHLLGTGPALSFTLAALIAWVPLVGSLGGFYGAVELWGWSPPQAFALFLAPPLVWLATKLLVRLAEQMSPWAPR